MFILLLPWGVIMPSFAKNTILIVEDTATNIDILIAALGERYDVRVALNGQSALELINASPPDLILLDIIMPGIDGYEVCAQLKANQKTADIPVIFLTAKTEVSDKTRAFEMGAVDYIVKPFSIIEVQSRVHAHLSLLVARRDLEKQNETLEKKVLERTKQLVLTQDTIFEAMASLAESRDQETADHVLRTRYYVQLLARQLSEHPRFQPFLKTIDMEDLGKAVILHDIGKVGVRDHILLKQGKLTHGEFQEIKKHATYGHEIIKKLKERLKENSFLCLADDVAWCHHEKWNGTGYPCGLAGDAIPVPGRLMALADVYDAIISRRIYKEPLTHEEAVNIIMEGSSGHFDPDVLNAFRILQDTFKTISEKLTPEKDLSLFFSGGEILNLDQIAKK